MGSNNYAEVISETTTAKKVLERLALLAREGSMFRVLAFNSDSDWFPISCGRRSNLPPLQEVEDFGTPVDGLSAKARWAKHAETAQAISFGNGFVGLMYECHGLAYMVIPDLEVLPATAPHVCPKCMTGFGCSEEPCTLAFESICRDCSLADEVEDTMFR